MKRTSASLTTIAAAASLALSSVTPAYAGTPSGGGGSNVVNVINSSGTAYRDHTKVTTYSGDSSQSSNVASALSRYCTGCRTRAVAVQVLIVTGNPTLFAPHNAASAVNYYCTACDTYAYAWQDVFQSAPGAKLSPSGQQAVADIQAQIDALTRDASISDVPYRGADGYLHDDLTDALNALTARLHNVVRDDLVATSGVIASAEAGSDASG